MKAQILHQPAPVNLQSLALTDFPKPEPVEGEIRVKVRACGVCHTDLHLVEGELPDPMLPVIPGHEIIGVVDAVGENATRHRIGDRVGIAWLNDSCGHCQYCRSGHENLCESAHFTGYTAHGGYAEYITVGESYAYPIPDVFSDSEAAPLLCAGVVGYRSLKLSDLQPGERLGLYGFGASAHICIQVAHYWDCEAYVFTRSQSHKQHARELGAVWVGDANDTPAQPLDRAIIFAPAGWIVPLALGHLRKAGTLCINAIHMSEIPAMPYELLWYERTIRSVANVTRQDAEEFLPLAAKIPIRPQVQTYPLSEANHVLQRVKESAVDGAAVLQIDG